MTENPAGTIRLKWVRSGIGLSYRQKEVIRSLGFRRMNQIVARPDTPQVRGLVAKVPHLVEIEKETVAPPDISVSEYSIFRPEAAPQPMPAPTAKPVSEERPVAGAVEEASGVRVAASSAHEPGELTSRAGETAEALAEKEPARESAPVRAHPAKPAARKAKPAKRLETKRAKKPAAKRPKATGKSKK